jgi:hypothetical protein
MLAGTTCLPSIARATTPNPAYMSVEFIVLNYQAATLDQSLRSIIPDQDDVLPLLADHVRSRIAEAGSDIKVAELPTYVNRPEGVTEPQTMHATVLLDLARWESSHDQVVGGVLIEVFRPFMEESVTDLMRPTAFFGASAQNESVAREFARTARERLDRLVRAITAYR